MIKMKTQKLPWLFFLALTLFYLSLSPGAISGMGYTAENMNASNQIISNLGDWFELRRAATQVIWPRHGLFELIFQIPFLLLSRLFFDSSVEWADRILAVDPILMTSLLCTLIFIWVHRITASLVWSYLLALMAGLSSMLWPYAYIGLETTQSLFLLLSGYLALGSNRKRTWPGALLFAVSCGLAVSVKSNGIFLAPAVASLVYFYFHGELTGSELKRVRAWVKPLVVVSLIGALYIINAYTRTLSQTWASGASSSFRAFSVDSPLIVIFNAFSILGSLNKGLIVYSPVVLLSLATFRQACRIDPRIVIFAGLTLVGLIGGCSLIFFWSDETWGPRYLHSSIGPLIICLALTKHSVRFRYRREIPLIALALLGLAISFLGAFFYYGTLHLTAIRSSQSTLEALQYDPNFNHIRFNLKLFELWLQGNHAPEGAAEFWPPARRWWFEPPPDAPALKTVNLREVATPQPSLVRGWGIHRPMPYQIVWHVYLTCLLLGPLLLVWLGYLVSRKVEPGVISS